MGCGAGLSWGGGAAEEVAGVGGVAGGCCG